MSIRILAPRNILRSKARQLEKFANFLMSRRAMTRSIKRTGKIPHASSNKVSVNKKNNKDTRKHLTQLEES